jgi:glycosyltransferase involved in cell wall biosynthesis
MTEIPPRRLRIAFILQDFHIGGMESWLYRVATQLRDHYDFHFIATHVPDILPKFPEIGTAVYLGQDWRRLTHYLHDQHIDIVQYANLREYGDAALAAGVPVVIERTDGLRQGVALRSKAGIDAVIASTRGTILTISRLITAERIHLIYNGIDVERFDKLQPDRLNFTPDDFVIGRVSRFGRGKNLALLIDAVRQLAPKYPQLRLVLVGGNSKAGLAADDEEVTLREHARGLEDHVCFTGYIEHPEALVRGFNVGTCVSRPGNEGIPNSLLESMAAAQPVIATAVDDIPELVEHNVTGLMIEDNKLDQLVAAIERLITDPALCSSLGAAARQRIEREFDLARQAAMYDALYQQLWRERTNGFALWRRRTYWVLILSIKVMTARLIPPALDTLFRRARSKLRVLLVHNDPL